jgi:hypothetical protein
MYNFLAPTCILTQVRTLMWSINKIKVYNLVIPFLYEHTFSIRMTFSNTVFAFMY